MMFNSMETTNIEELYTYDAQKLLDRIKRSPAWENIKTYHGKTFLIVGLGGLGMPITEMIARSFPSNIHLLLSDGDKLESVNLNRIATINDLGQRKSEITYQRIISIRPEIDVKVIPKITDDTLMPCADIIIDETDDFTVLSKALAECKNSIIIAMKYNGFDEGNLFINTKPLVVGNDDPYRIIPSTAPSAYYFASLLVLYLITHKYNDLKAERKVLHFKIPSFG